MSLERPFTLSKITVRYAGGGRALSIARLCLLYHFWYHALYKFSWKITEAIFNLLFKRHAIIFHTAGLKQCSFDKDMRYSFKGNTNWQKCVLKQKLHHPNYLSNPHLLHIVCSRCSKVCLLVNLFKPVLFKHIRAN